jgi:hypothetical protein
MVFTLLETANKQFDNAFIIQQARLLGETETGTGKALYAAIPTVLSGIITQVTGGARQLTRHLLDHHSAPPSGENLLDSLFHRQAGEVTRAVIHHAGIKSTSAWQILAAAAPAVFVAVREYAHAHQMSAPQLIHFLRRIAPDLAPTLPADMPEVTPVPDEVTETPVIPAVFNAPEAPAYAEAPPVTKPQLVNEPEPQPAAEATRLPEADEPEQYQEMEEEESPARPKRRRWITLTAVTAGALLAWYFFKGNCNNPPH